VTSPEGGWGFFTPPAGAPIAPPPGAPAFGTPTAPAYAPPPGTPAYGPPPAAPAYGPPQGVYGVPTYPYPVAAPARRGIPGWAIALIAGGGSLVVFVVLAAVAIPVFLNQREKAAAALYTVDQPTTVEGFTLSHDALAQRMDDDALSDLSPKQAETATALVYADTAGKPRLYVVVDRTGTLPARFADSVRAEERGFQQGTTTTLNFATVDPGTLGGLMQCATTGDSTICIWADRGTAGVVAAFGLTDGVTADRQAREAVVHRR
jgi:hypothetical protein